MFRFFIPLILLLIVPDLFIWWNFTRLQPGFWRTALLIAPTVATLLCMLLLLCQVRAVMLMELAFVLLVCIAVPKLLFFLFALLGKGVGFFSGNGENIFVRIGIVAAVLLAATQIYGTTFGWRKIVTCRTPISVQGLPAAFIGYRIVQISDLHLGTYAGDDRLVRRVVDSVNAQKPDLVVFTGDIVNVSSDELPPFINALRGLKARDGVLSILGNHDYCIYYPGLSPSEKAKHVSRIVQMEREMGWKVLLNENISLSRENDTLHVAGVENTGKPPFPSRGNLKKAMQGIPPTACTILLSHDPWHWRHGVVGKAPVSLTLSGHTHALQLQIGNFSPAQWFMPEWCGLYHEGAQQLYVSTGIGGTIPYRLGAWPKIEVLELQSSTLASE